MNLDLRKAVYQPMDLKLDGEDGEITLHIPAPTVAEWDDFMAAEAEAVSEHKLKDWHKRAALLVLNANSDGMEFTKDSLSDLPVQACRELINAYTGWVRGTLKN